MAGVGMTQIMRAAGVASLALFAASIDLFGLASDSAKFSADFAQYASSPYYGEHAGTRAAQEHITVVYLDEAGLEALYDTPAWRYPLTFDAYAQLLTDVANGAGADADGDPLPGPSAIFIDFTFLSKGRDEAGFKRFVDAVQAATRAQIWNAKTACLNDEVAKLACIRAAGGVPVLLGGEKHAPMTLARNARDDLLQASVMTSVKVEDRRYPLLGQTFAREDSPAALMLAADCLAAPTGCAPQDAYEAASSSAKDHVIRGDHAAGSTLTAAAERIREVGAGAFAVRWSSRQALGDTGANALHKALYGHPSPCAGALATPGRSHALGESLARVAQRLTPWRVSRTDDIQSAASPDCPYAMSLSYADYLTGPSLGSPLRKRLFSGQLVLIGGQYEASSDWVASPVHGQVAGVQYHAMALDNLLERRAVGKSVAKLDDPKAKSGALASATLIFIVVLGSNFYRMFLGFLRDRKGPKTDAWRAATLLLGYVAVLAVDLTVVWIAAVAAEAIDIPLNWVACLVIVLGHGVWSLRKDFKRDLTPLADAVRGLPWGKPSAEPDADTNPSAPSHP